MKREHFQLKETIVTIAAEEKTHIELAKKEIKKRRREIEQFIQKDDFFQITLEPYSCPNDAPEIIQKMCESSEKLNIGPMSTVAGIIAEYAVKAMIANGARHAIVDNGGDIALFSEITVNVGIYTGNHATSKFALQIVPQDKIIGVCTSSGKIGHSLSFGKTDAVTVLSYDVALADAAATALGNRVTTGKDIAQAFSIFEHITGISAAMIIIDNTIGLWGKMPPIIPAKVPYELITKGW